MRRCRLGSSGKIPDYGLQAMMYACDDIFHFMESQAFCKEIPLLKEKWRLDMLLNLFVRLNSPFFIDCNVKNYPTIEPLMMASNYE